MIVKEINGMQGLFASQDYKINDLLFTIEGEILDTPTRTSIQISTNQHVNVQAPLAFINHSCFPNICICLLYTSPSPRDRQKSRMPSSA